MNLQDITKVIDYVIESEVDDFFNNIMDLNLTHNQIEILVEWGEDLRSTDSQVKAIFSNIRDRHIYATAICLQYNI